MGRPSTGYSLIDNILVLYGRKAEISARVIFLVCEDLKRRRISDDMVGIGKGMPVKHCYLKIENILNENSNFTRLETYNKVL